VLVSFALLSLSVLDQERLSISLNSLSKRFFGASHIVVKVHASPHSVAFIVTFGVVVALVSNFAVHTNFDCLLYRPAVLLAITTTNWWVEETDWLFYTASPVSPVGNCRHTITNC
jgi:hypothetical protein